MTTEEKFVWIIYTCEERYSKKLMNKLANDILTTQERVNKVFNLVKQNPSEEFLIKKLKEIRRMGKKEKRL
ncbi:MAG: hypothetical protein ACI4RL_06090 [Ruminococcus sp.]